MITVCIDESGNFEGEKYEQDFVGGMIYTGRDYLKEEERLESFFKEQCKNLDINYPNDIHTTNMRRNSKMFKNEETMVKNVKQYIKENGNYKFVFIVKSKLKRMDYCNISNIVNDDNASNLYEHMVCKLLDNILFYNIKDKDYSDVNLRLATRVAQEKDLKKVEQYKKLGYNYKKIGEVYRFYLTDQRTFKTAISTKMMERKIERPINFDLEVESINYNYDGKTTPFLYLADFACDIIKVCLDKRSDNFAIEKAYIELKKVTGNECLCWAYDDIDTINNLIVSSYNSKDFIECLNGLYDISESESSFKGYYMKHWCKPIEEGLEKIFDSNKIEVYLSEINYLFSKDDKSYNRGLFMALKLFEIVEVFNCNEKDETKRLQGGYVYKIADMIGRGYNHLGDTENARTYFNICYENKDEVAIEDYIATINRMVEIDVNEFGFNAAIEKLEPSLLCLEIWKDTKKEVAQLMGLEKQRAFCLELRGKIVSSLGQFYSFKRNKGKALEYFELGLEEFQMAPNQRGVTLSYIMQLALDCKDYKLYKKYEKEYFGSDDINEQFKNVVINNDDKNSNDYKFYVYIKALDIMYGEKIDEKLLSKLQTADYSKLRFKINAHPWELIYKHLALLQYKNNNASLGDNWLKKAQDTVEEGGITIKLIKACIYIEVGLYTNDSKMIRGSLKSIKDICECNETVNKYFKDSFEIKDEKEKAGSVIEKFTFMYD